MVYRMSFALESRVIFTEVELMIGRFEKQLNRTSRYEMVLSFYHITVDPSEKLRFTLLSSRIKSKQEGSPGNGRQFNIKELALLMVSQVLNNLQHFKISGIPGMDKMA